MLSIAAEADSSWGGTLKLTCKTCGSETRNEWIRDKTACRFKATCERCDETAEFRLDLPRWNGRP